MTKDLPPSSPAIESDQEVDGGPLGSTEAKGRSFDLTAWLTLAVTIGLRGRCRVRRGNKGGGRIEKEANHHLPST